MLHVSTLGAGLAVIVGLSLAGPAWALRPPQMQTGPNAMVRLPGHVLAALAKARPIAPTDARSKAAEKNQPLLLTIVLKREKQTQFDRYMRDVYDSHSPLFHHFLTPHQVSHRFGPSPRAYDAVLNYLRSDGFGLAEGSANRLTLTVRGTRAQAERAFGVQIRDFESLGRRFFANDSNPRIPVHLARDIQGVAGLSNLAVPRPAMNLFTAIAANEIDLAIELDSAALQAEDAELRAMLLEIAKDTLSDAEFAKFEASMRVVGPVQAAAEEAIEEVTGFGKSRVGVARPPHPSTAVGAGQKIGLSAFSSIRLSDVADRLALTGLPASLLGQVTQVDVNGGAPLGPDQSDVLLAVDTILDLAPGAKIIVYDGPSTESGTTSFQALFNKMIDDHVTIISNSFGYCEDQTTLADVETIDTILATAAASGISVFSATGDSGSGCSDGSPDTIAVPADSPHATAIGGTSPIAGPGSTYQGEKWFDGSGDLVPTGQAGFGEAASSAGRRTRAA